MSAERENKENKMGTYVESDGDEKHLFGLNVEQQTRKKTDKLRE